MQNRKITLEVNKVTLPAYIHGVTIATGETDYNIALNDQDTELRQTAAFLHECLHIWHQDHHRTDPENIQELEEARHHELIQVLELLTQEEQEV